MDWPIDRVDKNWTELSVLRKNKWMYYIRNTKTLTADQRTCNTTHFCKGNTGEKVKPFLLLYLYAGGGECGGIQNYNYCRWLISWELIVRGLTRCPVKLKLMGCAYLVFHIAKKEESCISQAGRQAAGSSLLLRFGFKKPWAAVRAAPPSGGVFICVLLYTTKKKTGEI